jgi:hypothetical protein
MLGAVPEAAELRGASDPDDEPLMGAGAYEGGRCVGRGHGERTSKKASKKI